MTRTKNNCPGRVASASKSIPNYLSKAIKGQQRIGQKAKAIPFWLGKKITDEAAKRECSKRASG